MILSLLGVLRSLSRATPHQSGRLDSNFGVRETLAFATYHGTRIIDAIDTERPTISPTLEHPATTQPHDLALPYFRSIEPIPIVLVNQFIHMYHIYLMFALSPKQLCLTDQRRAIELRVERGPDSVSSRQHQFGDEFSRTTCSFSGYPTTRCFRAVKKKLFPRKCDRCHQ